MLQQLVSALHAQSSRSVANLMAGGLQIANDLKKHAGVHTFSAVVGARHSLGIVMRESAADSAAPLLLRPSQHNPDSEALC